MEAQHASASRAGHRRRPLFTAELDYTRQRAASTLHDVADWLDEADLVEFLTRAEGWARRRPGLFLGGAFVVGVVAARVYKGASQSATSGESATGASTSRPASASDATSAKRRATDDLSERSSGNAMRGRREGDRVPLYTDADLPSRPSPRRESSR